MENKHWIYIYASGYGWRTHIFLPVAIFKTYTTNWVTSSFVTQESNNFRLAAKYVSDTQILVQVGSGLTDGGAVYIYD